MAAAHRDRSGAEVLAWFDDARSRLLTAFRGLDPSLRVPWYGPPMSAASALTARIMETWAHGQDVADTLGVEREPTARLRHVAHIGIGARAYSYVVNGREVPTTPIRVELAAPDGATWTWGPEDAADRVVGPALDFCLVVTQRRHLGDTALEVSGPGRDRVDELRPGLRGPGGPRAGGVMRPVRIANCSGFYGDRLAAAREMVDGGPIDVLTGDYLAELTMLILAKAQAKDPGLGYARTFLSQVEEVLGPCLERGIKIVSNAGGLNPAGLAAAIEALGARVAHVEGDDLRGSLGAITPPVSGKPVSANAYLGGWGIAAALEAGADVVVTGRVTDASLVVGPAAWWHGWGPTDWDALAGAVVAGHVIECGPQATGGNYAFLDEITDRRYPGFPIAEVAEDGSSVITKHPGTGGLVSVGTVTAQLLYEIAGPAYLGPDVTTHFDTIALAPDGEHRVAITGVRGSPPPATLKVALNDVGGFRNTMTLVLTGLDVEAKAARAEELLFEVLGGRERFADVDVRLLRFDRPDAPTNDQATAHLRITVKDPDPRKVGRAFSNATMELALGGYAGFHTTTPPTTESAFGVYRPAAVPRAAVTQTVVLPGGERRSDPRPTHRRPADRRRDPRGPARAAADATAADATAGADRAGAARAGRRGAVGRQGRQRQHRAVGPRRRRVRVARRVPHRRAGARAARARGRGAADRRPPAAQPAGGQRRRARPARRRRRVVDPPGSAGQGPGGVPAQPGRRRAGGTAVSDLPDLSAGELVALVARGEASCVEVVGAHLDRIDALNPRVNAIVGLRDRADVLAEAAARDRVPRDGAERGPLHGLPIAVKDLSEVAGLPWTQGSPIFRDQVGAVDEPFVARLRAAGAVVVGKTNTPEMGFGSQTFNPVHGATRNPYDLGRTIGGSSGGAAAALAARMLPIADGSDYMGSLRNPAAFGNVLGFRPTAGTVVPPGPIAQLGELGPMGRTVADVARLLGVMAARPPAELDGPVAGTRVAWVGDLGGRLATEPGVLELGRRRRRRARRAGLRRRGARARVRPRRAVGRVPGVARPARAGARAAARRPGPARPAQAGGRLGGRARAGASPRSTSAGPPPCGSAGSRPSARCSSGSTPCSPPAPRCSRST